MMQARKNDVRARFRDFTQNRTGKKNCIKGKFVHFSEKNGMNKRLLIFWFIEGMIKKKCARARSVCTEGT